MKRFLILLTICGSLSGCTVDPGITGVSGVRSATASEVGQCAYIADFRMKPGVYGALAEQGVNYARNRIMADARDAGANAIVFDAAPPGVATYELHATGYRC